MNTNQVNKTKKASIVNDNENDNIEKLSKLYKEGLNSKALTNHSRMYNYLVIILSIVFSTCIGVIIAYIIYVKFS